MMYGNTRSSVVVLPSWYLTLPEGKRRSAAVRTRLAVVDRGDEKAPGL